MPIVIKEIHVKTTIEKHPVSSDITEDTAFKLKKRILKELEEKNNRVITWKKER